MIVMLLYMYLSKYPNEKGLTNAFLADFFLLAIIEFIIGLIYTGVSGR